jgi:hypothetical protein
VLFERVKLTRRDLVSLDLVFLGEEGAHVLDERAAGCGGPTFFGSFRA